MRKSLSDEEVLQNAKTYEEQVKEKENEEARA